MVRSVVIKEVPKKKLDIYRDRGWTVLDSSRGLYRIRRKLDKWQRFEARMRELFLDAGFEHAIDPYEFWHDELGNQVDVCGGVGEHFIIMDCTTKNEDGFKSIREKIKDNHFKMRGLTRGVASAFRGRYKYVHFVICSHDIDLDPKEVQEAKDHQIVLIDSSVMAQWEHVVEVLGPAVRYQILEVLAGARIPIEGDSRKPLRYHSLRILVSPASVSSEEPRYVYLFAIDPETLIKLAVVYRLKYMDPLGYQRDLRPGKLRLINEYLSDWSNFFPNSVLVAFDEDSARKIDWKPEGAAADGPVESGTISIPRYHGVAEIIDGQHRLYGYIDFTKDKDFEKVLKERRNADRLLVVAIPDPGGSERPGLYLAINSTQTKISTREIWSLMGDTRPNTKMGFISNVVRALNSKGILRDEIEIPRITRGTRSVNIANLGKGISDRHLIDNQGEQFNWNLWIGPRIGGPYPEVPDTRIIDNLEMSFRCVRDSYPDDWRNRESFLRSNNGVNVMLRVFVEILKYYQGKALTVDRIGRLLRPTVRAFVKEYGVEELLRDTSNEVGREATAREMMKRINKKYSGFAHAYLEQKKGRRKSR